MNRIKLLFGTGLILLGIWGPILLPPTAQASLTGGTAYVIGVMIVVSTVWWS